MRNRIIPYNPALKELARNLRKTVTVSEELLWQKIKLKSLGVEFHRQVPMDNYIVDFYCHEIMLAIEIDGSSHDDLVVKKNDIFRQDKLEGYGVRFIRFDDLEVKRNISNVIARLQERVNTLMNDGNLT
jgi:very-short-patch-repair endonuclease